MLYHLRYAHSVSIRSGKFSLKSTHFAGLLFGLDTGIISGVLVEIGGDLTNGVELTDNQKELITSATTLGALLGSFSTPPPLAIPKLTHQHRWSSRWCLERLVRPQGHVSPENLATVHWTEDGPGSRGCRLHRRFYRPSGVP